MLKYQMSKHHNYTYIRVVMNAYAIQNHSVTIISNRAYLDKAKLVNTW